MRKFMVSLLVLCLVGVAWAETWQNWSSPDSKYSLDFPTAPSKVKDEGGIALWQSTGENAIYMVVSVDQPELTKMTEAEQDQLAHVFATEFFKGAQITTSSEKKLSDGYEYAGTMGDEKAALAAQVRKSGAQGRIYILLTVGQGDANHLFNSFKAN